MDAIVGRIVVDDDLKVWVTLLETALESAPQIFRAVIRGHADGNQRGKRTRHGGGIIPDGSYRCNKCRAEALLFCHIYGILYLLPVFIYCNWFRYLDLKQKREEILKRESRDFGGWKGHAPQRGNSS